VLPELGTKRKREKCQCLNESYGLHCLPPFFCLPGQAAAMAVSRPPRGGLHVVLVRPAKREPTADVSRGNEKKKGDKRWGLMDSWLRMALPLVIANLKVHREST